MPEKHEVPADIPGEEEAHELVDLVEVVLGLDVVFLLGGGLGEGEDGGEGYGAAVEGDEPDCEGLGDCDVEEEV